MTPMSWFVVRTQPHAEEKAVRHLGNQGFSTYLPRYRRRVRHARCVVNALRPLFPGYLFVFAWGITDQWRRIRACPGVVRIVCRSEAPVTVSGRSRRESDCHNRASPSSGRGRRG